MTNEKSVSSSLEHLPVHLRHIYSSNSSAEGRLRAWLQMEKNWDNEWQEGDWGLSILPFVELESAFPDEPQPYIVFTFAVQMAHCNRIGTLHGGCIATLFDLLTSMVLLTVNEKPGHWQRLGVTRALNCNYLRPAKAGDQCRVECAIVHVGRNLSLLKGTLRRVQDNLVLATCEHHKVNTDTIAGKL
ncbi:thioesterase family [Colletotrichum karsti]|uniref:Thioesterase family n=1 Tax=Colletotrichum karsti TaxID=1095194 RepID=A0A9P6IIU3_9PEZI|nr:thioesterase family [Colletotrichum karsti]KAF9882291.1 thioesterase family [Colletotrichum karsti]